MKKNRKGAGNYRVTKNKMIKLNKCLINYIRHNNSLF